MESPYPPAFVAASSRLTTHGTDPGFDLKYIAMAVYVDDNRTNAKPYLKSLLCSFLIVFDILHFRRYTMSHLYTGQKKIKEIIYKVLEPTLDQQGWYFSKIMMNWEMLITAQWKDHIRPTRYVPNFKDRSTGVLHVKVSHMGMQQIQFTKGFLIEKFNLYLGCSAIQDIKPQLWHQPQPTLTVPKRLKSLTAIPKPVIENISDINLKDALEDFAHILKSR